MLDVEFKTLVIRMLSDSVRLQQHKKSMETIKKKSEMKDTLVKVKNNLNNL